jgi:hypothetical protein
MAFATHIFQDDACIFMICMVMVSKFRFLLNSGELLMTLKLINEDLRYILSE